MWPSSLRMLIGPSFIAFSPNARLEGASQSAQVYKRVPSIRIAEGNCSPGNRLVDLIVWAFCRLLNTKELGDQRGAASRFIAYADNFPTFLFWRLIYQLRLPVLMRSDNWTVSLEPSVVNLTSSRHCQLTVNYSHDEWTSNKCWTLRRKFWSEKLTKTHQFTETHFGKLNLPESAVTWSSADYLINIWLSLWKGRRNSRVAVRCDECIVKHKTTPGP